MTIDQFDLYAPQKSFLVQGSEAFFDTLLASALVRHAIVHSLSVPRFTVDHAKAAAQFLIEGSGETRVYILYFTVFSPDAAQVLLKSLEEPDTQTLIILVTPHPYLVPQTIRSRAMLIASQTQPTVQKIDEATFFMSRDALLTQIKNEFGGDADDDAATKRARAVYILDILEMQVRSDAEKVAAIYAAKHMLFAANMPTKYVLEYAASMVL